MIIINILNNIYNNNTIINEFLKYFTKETIGNEEIPENFKKLLIYSINSNFIYEEFYNHKFFKSQNCSKNIIFCNCIECENENNIEIFIENLNKNNYDFPTKEKEYLKEIKNKFPKDFYVTLPNFNPQDFIFLFVSIDSNDEIKNGFIFQNIFQNENFQFCYEIYSLLNKNYEGKNKFKICFEDINNILKKFNLNLDEKSYKFKILNKLIEKIDLPHFF